MNFRVVGEGPEKKRWQRLARRYGADRHITWAGQLTHEATMAQYAWADVFAFTSLRDTTGTVIVEALGHGLPVVCLDHQGAHDVVTEQCGIKVPVTTPREVIDRLADAVVSLARDPQRCEQLSQGAIERAQHYSWSRQGEEMAAIYRRVLDAQDVAVHQSPSVQRPRHLLNAARRAAMAVARPIDSLLGRPASQGVGILLYHRIAAPTTGVAQPTYNVTPSRFRSQMQGLLARGYTPWPLRRVVQWHCTGRPIPPRTFVVTFDDGYENVYCHAWPTLWELQIPATIFVTTSCLDAQTAFASDDWSAAGFDGRTARVVASAVDCPVCRDGRQWSCRSRMPYAYPSGFHRPPGRFSPRRSSVIGHLAGAIRSGQRHDGVSVWNLWTGTGGRSPACRRPALRFDDRERASHAAERSVFLGDE